MAGVRVFVSHHHSPDEDAFTARLVNDLKTGGADVWVDDQGITSEDFVRKISEGLAGSQWLVLVMTPASVTSPWVRREVNAALNEVTAGRMLGVIPLLMLPTDERDVLALWRTLHRYDATRGYEPALDSLLHAMGLTLPQRPAALKPGGQLYQPEPFTPVSFAQMVPQFPPPIVPKRLAQLGYQGINFNGRPTFIPPLITVPAGPFIMGSDPTRDPRARQDEMPQHWVELATFQIAKYPVTVAEYALAVRSGGVVAPPDSDHVTWEQQKENPDHPVVCVSWTDANDYIAWLTITTGSSGWRLPTEAQWEKAARWDTQWEESLIYPWGNYFEAGRCIARSRMGAIVPIGSYPAKDKRHSGASPYGVEEMTGNILEWTSTLYGSYPYSMSDGREDQQSANMRTLRGGSRVSTVGDVLTEDRNDNVPITVNSTLRAARRTHDAPDSRRDNRGFRVAFT